MSETNPSPNIEPVRDPLYGYNLIRMAFALIGGLALSYLVASVIMPAYNVPVDAAAQTIISSAITGFFGFIAGRKT